jgi:hypothetical protein
MGVKAEITWKTRMADGARREVNAQRVGGEWRFFVRERRFDQWAPLEHPPLEDWLELLDAVQRRVARRLLTPDHESRLRKTIAELYPDAALP